MCVCLHTDKLLWYVYTCSFVSKTASWFILDSWVFVFVSVANSVMCLLCSVRNSFLGCEVCLYNQALKQMLLISIDLSFCWRSTCKISLRYSFSPMVVSVVAMAAHQPQRQAEKSWTMKCEGIHQTKEEATACCVTAALIKTVCWEVIGQF